MYSIPRLRTWTTPRATAAANTVIFQIIPPYPGPPGNVSPFMYSVTNQVLPGSTGVIGGVGNWLSGKGAAVTHVRRIEYQTGTTAHQIAVIRPTNWTVVTTAVAKNSATIILATDPGVYSTNYNYATNLTSAANLVGYADDPIGSADYLACQLTDGTWYVSKVSSVSSLTMTMVTSTPNITGGGIAANTPIFFFPVGLTSNIPTDLDPANGMLAAQVWDTIAAGSGVASQSFPVVGDDDGFITALHPGDPLLFWSNNLTAQGYLELANGFYGQV